MSNPSHNKTQSEDTTKATKPDNSLQVDKKKKSIFSKKGRNGRESDEMYAGRDAAIDRHPNSRIESLNLCSYDEMQHEFAEKKEYRMFVGTWNVGGRTPHIGLNLEDFLQVEGETDIYVLGFQEIVPLNAGNVLVSEDNEPATKWLALISQVLNKPSQQSTSLDDPSPSKQSNYVKEKATSATPFQKNSLKAISKVCRANSALAKTCNCSLEPSGVHQRARELREFVQRVESSSFDEDSPIQSCGDKKTKDATMNIV
ncbi:hypothetical protein HPP92_027728 [Vanilla planifolia]|uniref:Inositol polyphosphate-related phosphatase domain-containing protein n=1 Tax=Vanilla planifolia TaxID=51239 RepID=A0A835P815_VANPL|nr:hypothetical protein HPP92_027728 [Vanilla planifolia]